MAQFDFAVIGRGMMGAAAARHLSSETGRVALIGPVEPENKKTHKGVFASHYDEGRITRTIDPDPVWARLAHESINRYRDLESQSGISFYGEVGCIIAGVLSEHSARYVMKTRSNAVTFGLNTEDHDQASLAERFPYLDFPSDVDAIFEKDNAGTISPRRMVTAQAKACELNGASVINAVVKCVRHRSDHAEIELEGGDRITAAKVLVCTGGFTIIPGLLPDPLDIEVHGRTVTLLELGEKERKRLKGMPSMIFEAENPDEGVYLLPPVVYPDGKFYLKLGTEPLEGVFNNVAAIGDWFRSDGRADISEFNISQIRRFVPDLKEESVSTLTCVTTHTPTGYPAIGWSDSRFIGVTAGGCGSSAKSSDEIGRLGAMLMMHGSLGGQGYEADFGPRFK